MGTIGHQADLSTNIRSSGLFDIILPTLLSASGETEHEVTNPVRHGVVLQEPQPPSRPEYPPQSTPGRTGEVNTDTNGSTFESTPPARANLMVDLSHPEGQFSSATPVYNRNYYCEITIGSSVPRKRRRSEADDTEATQTVVSEGSVWKHSRPRERSVPGAGYDHSPRFSQDTVSNIVYRFQMC